MRRNICICTITDTSAITGRRAISLKRPCIKRERLALSARPTPSAAPSGATCAVNQYKVPLVSCFLIAAPMALFAESAKKPTGNSSSTTPVGSNKVVPPSTPLPRPVTESTLSTTTETPTTTFSPSPSVSTTAIRTEPTTKAPPALEQPDADVPCIVGSVQCPAAYRGASWSWRQETSTISPSTQLVAKL